MNIEAMATLEAVEAKVKSGFDKGIEARERTRAQLRQVLEKEAIMAAKHKEDMEKQEMLKLSSLAESMQKKDKAVKEFEKQKMKKQREARTRNVEKKNVTVQ